MDTGDAFEEAFPNITDIDMVVAEQTRDRTPILYNDGEGRRPSHRAGGGNDPKIIVGTPRNPIPSLQAVTMIVGGPIHAKNGLIRRFLHGE